MFCKVFFVKAWIPDRRRDEEIYCFDSDTCNNNHSKTICTEGYLHSHVTLFSTAFLFFFWSFHTSLLSLFKLHVLCEILEGLLAGWSTSAKLAFKDRLIRPLREHFAVVENCTQIICEERFFV